MVWKTCNVTFTFYLKTKTLQVQGKAIDPIREILFQSLGHSHQDSTANETVLSNEADNLSNKSAPLAPISYGISECTNICLLVAKGNWNSCPKKLSC